MKRNESPGYASRQIICADYRKYYLPDNYVCGVLVRCDTFKHRSIKDHRREARFPAPILLRGRLGRCQ
jgi:hypothetical protein